jgi:ABC-2 type transport system permease protein
VNGASRDMSAPPGPHRPPLRAPIPHALAVAASHARVAAQEELQYRGNAWIHLVNAIVELAVSLVALWLVYRHVDTLGGWSQDDLLVVLGCFFVLGAVINGVIHSSTSQLVADIRLGTFDFRLLKPVDAQFVALVQKVNAWRTIDLGLGAGLIVVGLRRSDQATTLAHAGAAAAMFACALAIVAGFWLLLSCLTFWTIQGEGVLWALDDTYDHLRWPVSLLPPGLRLALTTLFPAGFAVTIPAEALTGRLDWVTAAMAAGLAVGFLVAARLFWHLALRRYEGASG